MLKNNNERKQWIENEDNYEIITVSEFARYRKSRPLDDGSCIVVFETKMRGSTWDHEKNKIVEKSSGVKSECLLHILMKMKRF